jgi:hypothetical protein
MLRSHPSLRLRWFGGTLVLVRRLAGSCRGSHQAAGTLTCAGRRAHDRTPKLRTRNAAAKEETLAVVRRKNAELADLEVCDHQNGILLDFGQSRRGEGVALLAGAGRHHRGPIECVLCEREGREHDVPGPADGVAGLH